MNISPAEQPFKLEDYLDEIESKAKYKSPYEMSKVVYGDQVVHLSPKRDMKKCCAFDLYLAKLQEVFAQSTGGLQTFK